ncbi:Dna topoisomerase Iia AtpaseADP [Blyttiomyces helicus]|uniref:DNA topoisomerase 2 n=1 Tax=Blyttiomyces helicus TaxID=388810 RepID=A0A4P9WER8_9FUNG|nr:Dna topoisomerase Iia AtpaseADP [Blyttiomyces helicus]|eukprot:RKO89490.1 Dna topoisomerase Iia AtpaseADP [Blyttiomyces helicus]
MDVDVQIPAAAGTAAEKKSAASSKSVEEIYQKKTPIEHVLLRPDSYIGSIEYQTVPMWVLDGEAGMVFRNVSYVPGLYKIFDEIIVRDSTMDTIKVVIDPVTSTISVHNNGRGIPIEIHAKEKVYVPELIFGNLLTSSNYDDGEKKTTGGRNGYGAKLANIFSTEFIVETADAVTGKKFMQVFNNNMSKKSTPKITDNPKGEDFTRITFKPDLAKFGMTHLDDDFVALATKRVHDLAGCIRGIKVFLNDTRLKLKDFRDYVSLYLPDTGANKPVIIHERPSERWEVAFSLSDSSTGFQQVSFVNSISTTKGGTHVAHVADQIVNTLLEAAKKKDKKAAPLKPMQVRNHLWVFVNCQIENPAFDSQTKENMTLKPSSFGSKCTLSEEFLKKSRHDLQTPTFILKYDY